MKFADLLAIVADRPVFESGFLLTGDVDPGDVRRQLSRWAACGKILQLRRGVYALAPPYRKGRPDPLLIACALVRPSYVSCEAALSLHGLIPEMPQAVTSITTRRPGTYSTALGRFVYRHVSVDRFWGFEASDSEASILCASPEKALLDLIYLTPRAADEAYLRELRLQRLDRLDTEALARMAARFGGPKLAAAAMFLQRLASEEAAEYRAR
ncbi:MAG: hypothetical protein FJZ01_03485 [Candidatus Sericytochromatia bacterium]|nr:hypothetical protein [Candidatus Tanganyikabacteria bacterium]